MMELTRWLPTWMIRPVLRCAAITAWPSSMECTMGFSQYTSFPAFMASMEACACQWSGVGVHGVDGSLRVPVVRRSHNDGVDVLARQQFAIVRRQEEILSKYLPRPRAPARVKIGNRHQCGSAHLVERRVHIRRAAPAQPDCAKLDAVVGGDRALRRRAGQRRGPGRTEKLASGSGHPKLPPRVYL